MKISQATAKGSRPYQEDRSFVLPTAKGLYMGVFDGHGGDACAEYCVKKFPAILQCTFYLYDAMGILADETRMMHTGSTASVVFIPKGEASVEVAVIGDSPVVVKGADQSIWIAPEHNVRTNMAEADAARQRGGYINGGYLFAGFNGDGLQMSRALGDVSLDSVLLREPEASIHALGANSFVLVASDGAFDPAHKTSPLGAIAAAIERGAIAQDIVDNALGVPTRDNVTALLVTL